MERGLQRTNGYLKRLLTTQAISAMNIETAFARIQRVKSWQREGE